jgi:renalase
MLEDAMDVAIVGAGLAGLTCARELQKAGLSARLWDKGRGVGGRMATRRIEAEGERAAFDHGAQFFTARSPEFGASVEDWRGQGLAREWFRGQSKARFQDGSPQVETEADGHPRFCAPGGMNAIPKYLARGLDVQTGQRIGQLSRDGEDWTLRNESGVEMGRARALVLTPPVPQSLALLGSSQIELPEDLRGGLELLRYDPCVAVMLWLSEPTRIPAPGALYCEGEPLAWLGDNTQKGLCQPFALTVHAAPAWSEDNCALSDEETVRELSNAARDFWRGEILASSVARWKYSKPSNPRTDGCARWDQRKLVFAGDAFGGAKVEGAFLSGLAASRVVRELLA